MSLQADDAWMADAKCRGHDVDLWYPTEEEVRGQSAHNRIAQAKAVCRECPVQQECLEYGMRHENYGVWGGATVMERRRLRRSRRMSMSPRAAVVTDQDRKRMRSPSHVR